MKVYREVEVKLDEPTTSALYMRQQLLSDGMMDGPQTRSKHSAQKHSSPDEDQTLINQVLLSYPWFT